jgi:ABC-type enterochelin transport system, permease component
MRAEAATAGVSRTSPGLVLVVLGLLVAAVATAFMTVGVKGNWEFVLALRGRKLAAIAFVATAIAVSTVIFQTVTANRILTPSIMGFDALYVLMQTAAVFFFGSARISALDPRLAFVLEAGAMVGFSLLLYRWLFLGRRRNLHLLLLVGVVFGLFFRSLTTLFQRIIDPNEFVVLQDRLFASFNAVAPALLAVAAIAIPAACLLAWRMHDRLDVLLLGREQAVNLGLDYRRSVSLVLVVVALLVSVATALVGPLNGMEPVSFFGLLVASLAYAVMPSFRHRHVLPAAALIGILVLVGGQLVLEQWLGFDSAVGIVIEFVGGITFLLMLFRRMAR